MSRCVCNRLGEVSLIIASNTDACKILEIENDKQIKDIILKDVIQVGKSLGLKSFEQVKDIYLYPELFSVENNLLTSTFKNKRPQLRHFFKQNIQDLYSKHET